MDYYTGDYFNNSMTIAILPVRNDMSFMRFFAFAQNDRIINYSSDWDCHVTSPLSP